MAGLFGETAELSRDVRVVGGNLVGNPKRNDTGALLPERSGMGIRAVSHFQGGRQDPLAGLLGHVGVAGEGEGHQLAGNAEFFGNLCLGNHGPVESLNGIHPCFASVLTFG